MNYVANSAALMPRCLNFSNLSIHYSQNKFVPEVKPILRFAEAKRTIYVQISTYLTPFGCVIMFHSRRCAVKAVWKCFTVRKYLTPRLRCSALSSSIWNDMRDGLSTPTITLAAHHDLMIRINITLVIRERMWEKVSGVRDLHRSGVLKHRELRLCMFFVQWYKGRPCA